MYSCEWMKGHSPVLVHLSSHCLRFVMYLRRKALLKDVDSVTVSSFCSTVQVFSSRYQARHCLVVCGLCSRVPFVAEDVDVTGLANSNADDDAVRSLAGVVPECARSFAGYSHSSPRSRHRRQVGCSLPHLLLALAHNRQAWLSSGGGI